MNEALHFKEKNNIPRKEEGKSNKGSNSLHGFSNEENYKKRGERLVLVALHMIEIIALDIQNNKGKESGNSYSFHSIAPRWTIIQ